MPLSSPVSRTPGHLRDVRYRSFERSDGLWDIEGELIDTKACDTILPGPRLVKAGDAIHHMLIRATVDEQLVVQAIEAAMDRHPHDTCPPALESMQRMVGCSMASGWRKAIEQHMGNVQGCTHMRELLFNMATAAFQSIQGAFIPGDPSQPPRHLGQCKGWDFNGAAVARIYPQFVGWKR